MSDCPGDQISFEEFLAFKKLHGERTEEDLERLVLEFKLVDTDANGRIDWWEFLTYQAKMKLFSRNQVSLRTPDVSGQNQALFTKLGQS